MNIKNKIFTLVLLFLLACFIYGCANWQIFQTELDSDSEKESESISETEPDITGPEENYLEETILETEEIIEPEEIFELDEYRKAAIEENWYIDGGYFTDSVFWARKYLLDLLPSAEIRSETKGMGTIFDRNMFVREGAGLEVGFEIWTLEYAHRELIDLFTVELVYINASEDFYKDLKSTWCEYISPDNYYLDHNRQYLSGIIIKEDINQELNARDIYDFLLADSRVAPYLNDFPANKFDDSVITEYNLSELIAGNIPEGAYLANYETQADENGNFVLKYYVHKNYERISCEIRVVDRLSGEILESRSEPVDDYTRKSEEYISPDGKYKIISKENYDFYILDIASGEEKLIYPATSGVVLDADGNYISEDIGKYDIPYFRFFTEDCRVVFCRGGYEWIWCTGIYDPVTQKTEFIKTGMYPVSEKDNKIFFHGSGYSCPVGFMYADISDLENIIITDLSETEGAKLRGENSLIISPDHKYYATITYDQEFIEPIKTPDTSENTRVIIISKLDTAEVYKTFIIDTAICSPQYISFIDSETLLVTCERRAMFDDYLFVIDLK